ncbi:MAG: hypothetical protein B0D86_05320, partial [Candidatus Sedimenticola endophacoides]
TIPLASPAATGNAPREPNLAALGDLGKSLGLDDGEREIPTPEEAFRFSAEVSDAQHLRLLWQIAEGTYLYQEQVRIGLGGSGGVTLGDYTLPAPEIKKNAIRPDGSTGDLAVYHNQIDLTLPLRRATPEATAITLEVRYQGCAEAGVCYPPVTRRIDLALPALQPGAPGQPPAQPQPKSGIPASPAGDEALSEQDRIASTISGGNLWVIIPTFFGLGLLLSLTPCVFPMIPILSGIIAGHGTQISAGKGFTLSMVYVQAMALTYTAVGIATGLSGANLQAAFQDPWILSAFALVFVLLALSMFGFYDLQLPSRWQSKLTEVSNRQQGGSLIGVAVMGLLSALIVGPCVAPPLFGALIYIGQTGDALLGGIALYALSMGMGAPLLLIGTSAGRLLPRAGAWMDTIKAVFGVALLAVSIIMLERILPPALAMTLWGVLLISSAIYLGALQPLPVEASGWDRLWKGVGVVLLVYGSLMLVAPVDAAFLRASQQGVAGDGVVVGLLDADEQRFLASSEPEKVARGERMETAHRDYLITSQAFYEYEGAALNLQFATLVPHAAVRAVQASVVDVGRHQLLVSAVTFITVFTLVFSLLSARLNRIMSRISFFSRKALGSEQPMVEGGNQLLALEDWVKQFIRLVRKTREEMRLKYEFEVQESETLKRAIMETSLDSIITIDQDGRIVEINTTAEKVFGYLRHEAIGREFAGLLLDEESAARFPALWAGLRQGRAPADLRTEMTALGVGGKPFPAELAIKPLALHGRSMLTVYLRDITERKRAEQEILCLAKFPAESPSPVLRVNRSGVIIYANASSARLLEYWGCEEGQTLPPYWREQVGHVLGSGKVWEVDVAWGESIFSLLFTPVVDLDYVKIYGRDISA